MKKRWGMEKILLQEFLCVRKNVSFLTSIHILFYKNITFLTNIHISFYKHVPF